MVVEEPILVILREINETHKIFNKFSKLNNDALKNKKLDLFKKTNLAHRYLSLIKGKDDITQKLSHNLFKHAELERFVI